MEREVLNAEEAAEFLGVDRKTVYEAVARRQLPHRRLGKRILFSKTALLDVAQGRAAARQRAKVGARDTGGARPACREVQAIAARAGLLLAAHHGRDR